MKSSIVCCMSCLAICCAVGIANSQNKSIPAEYNEEENIKQAWAAIENFFVAFNNEDNDAMHPYMTFPHMFLSRNGSVSIQEERWSMNFDRMKESQDWVKSTLDSREATMVYADKVHFKITFSRHNSKGERYHVQEGIYIVTRKDGKWGLQVRSY